MFKNNHINKFKSFGSLISGSVAGYFLVLLVSPIITRIYSPEEFGRFAVFGSIVAVFSIIATLSFEFGILGSLSKTLALRFSLTATLVAGLLLLLGLFISLVLSLLGLVDFILSPFQIILAFASCFIAVITNIAINIAIHSNRSAEAAKGTFFSLSTRSLLQVGFGYSFGGLNGLIYGDVIGRLIGWFAVERGLFRVALKGFLSYRKIVWGHIKKNTSYIFYLTPANAVETSLVWLLAPLFTMFYDPFIGGVVAMVQRLASAPLTIINQSLGQVFHNYAAKSYEKNSLKIIQYTLLITFFSLPFLAIFMAIFWIYGEKISMFIFGDQWGWAGYVMFMFLPFYYVYFLSLITNRLLMIMCREYVKLIASIINICLLLVSLPLAAFMGFDWKGGMSILIGFLTFSHLLFFIIVLLLVLKCPRPGSFILDKFFFKRT